LLAGQIDMMIDAPAVVLPQLRAGAIKAFAVLKKTRLPQAADVPTVDEAGLPGFYASNWFGFWVPKGTPKDIVATLNAAVVRTLADPALRQRFGDLGYEVPSPNQQTPESLGAFQRAEIEKWWPIIRAANIKGE
jgi:tripartite-type tricarboxylate transporter receptor subunit TctC